MDFDLNPSIGNLNKISLIKYDATKVSRGLNYLNLNLQFIHVFPYRAESQAPGDGGLAAEARYLYCQYKKYF